MNPSQPSRRRRLQIILWLAIPLVIFAAAELVFRKRYPFQPHYWQPVAKATADQSLDVLFIGNSQVACAIDTAAFAAAFAQQSGKRPTVVNAGMGWSVPFQHYLGLKRMAREHPDVLRGLTVFVDAPGGLPAHAPHGTNLYSAERPDFLWGLVGWSELPEVWSARPTLEQKSRLLASWGIGQSALLSRANQIGSGFVDKNRRKFATTVRGWRKKPAPAPTESASVDLTRAGGVRIDAQGIALVKDLVARNTERDLQTQKPLDDWDATDVAAIVRLVHAAGGRVVFYHMPIHSTQARAYDTTIRRADQQIFLAQAKTWNTPFLHAECEPTDEAFPDHLHLGVSHAAAFSQALARAWATAP